MYSSRHFRHLERLLAFIFNIIVNDADTARSKFWRIKCWITDPRNLGLGDMRDCPF